MTGLHGQCDGNMSSFSVTVSGLIHLVKKEKLQTFCVCVTQNHVYILGGHLLVTGHHAGYIA